MNGRAGPVDPSGGSVRPSVLVSLGGGLAAAGVAWAAMRLVRAAFQVRTVPERLMEWALLFVPLDLFEAGLRRFGFGAKQYALAGAVAAVLALLAALGAVVLRRGWSGPALGALGLGLWLITMALVMPLTGAGLFATDLIRGTGAAIAGHLTVALAYAGALATARALAGPSTEEPTQRRTLRSSAVLLVGGAVAAFACTPLVARWSPQAAVPAAVVPQAPAAPPPGARPPAAASDAGGNPAARPIAGPPAVPEPREWETATLDAVANGNVGRAVELVATARVPAATRPAPGVAGPPWAFVGEVHEYAGTVERLRAYPPGGPAPPWPTDRRPLSEVVLTGSAEAGRMPVVCLMLGDAAGLREGDQASARGYLVGLADAEDESGGSITGLVIVGEVTRR
jgi:hypothetical protein